MISARFNMQKLREEHYEALNAAKDNGTTETIEELYRLSQTLEYKIYFLWLILLVILDMYNHMYQLLIHTEIQVKNSLKIYNKKGGQNLNKLKPWKILLRQER